MVDQDDTLERGYRGHHALEDQAVGSGGDTILRRDENRNGVFVDTDLHYLDLLFLDHRHYRYRRVHVDLLLVAVLLGDEVRERLAGYVDHVQRSLVGFLYRVMNRVGTCSTGSRRHGDERFITERLAGQGLLRLLRYKDGLIVVASDILYQRHSSVQIRSLGSSQLKCVFVVRALEILDPTLLYEDHLEGIDIRFLNHVGDRISTCTHTLGSHVDLTDERVGGAVQLAHCDRLPFVAGLPREIREGSCTYRQGNGVVDRIRAVVLQRVTVLIDHRQGIYVRLCELEGNDVSGSVSLILRQYLDSSLTFLGINDGR